MKLMRLMTMLLILILVSTPVLASACAISCALNHASEAQLKEMAMPSMDVGHCEHMKSSKIKHDSSQDKHKVQHSDCSLAGCHFSTAATHVLGTPYFVVDGPDQQPLHFSAFTRSAELPPPIKPPA